MLINLRLTVLADRRDDWLAGIRRYTAAVRSEPGGPSFEFFESLDEPNEFAIIESFSSSEAGDRHVATAHFREFIDFLPSVLAAQPKIINVEVGQDEWSTMSEVTIEN
jgi:quinol monooxygenase YgiN